MPDPSRTHSARSVWTLIGVETLCFLGTEISRFGVSVWIYEETKSVYAFEALLLANTLPGILVAPFAGNIVDKQPRKRVMIGASVVAMIGTLIVLGGAAFDHLSLLPIVLGAMLASVGEAFQWPALAATIPLMATEEDLPRYNGFLESGRAASMLAGPVVGGILFGYLHLSGLLAVEVFTFTTATIVVSTLFVPAPEKAEPGGEGHEEEGESFLKDSFFGLRWIWKRKTLLKFLAVAVFANFFLSIGMVLMTPYGLSILDEKKYGLANGLFGGGMIVGGIVYGRLEKHVKNIHLFLWTAILMGIVYATYGFARGLVVLAFLNFMQAMLMTIGNGGIITIWQKNIPEEYQGRVLSAVRMVADATGPISYLLAGPLADRFVPSLFAGTSSFSQRIVHTWGAGRSGEMGFVFSILGVVLFIGFALATSFKDLRRVEDIQSAPLANVTADL